MVVRGSKDAGYPEYITVNITLESLRISTADNFATIN